MLRSFIQQRHKRQRSLELTGEVIKLHYVLAEKDISCPGEAACDVGSKLFGLHFGSDIIKRISVLIYEAGVNAVIHAGGGEADILITDGEIRIIVKDNGPGIYDIDLAMTPGWSTASAADREDGFGAGSGLLNIERYSDGLKIESEAGKGTTVTMTVKTKTD